MITRDSLDLSVFYILLQLAWCCVMGTFTVKSWKVQETVVSHPYNIKFVVMAMCATFAVTSLHL